MVAGPGGLLDELQQLVVSLDRGARRDFFQDDTLHRLGLEELAHSLDSLDGHSTIGGSGKRLGVDDRRISGIRRADGDGAARRGRLQHHDALGIVGVAAVGEVADDHLVVGPVCGELGQVLAGGRVQPRQRRVGQLLPAEVVGASIGEDAGVVVVEGVFRRGCKLGIEQLRFGRGVNLPQRGHEHVVLHVLPDARAIRNNLDAVFFERLGRADAGNHEHLRRLHLRLR